MVHVNLSISISEVWTWQVPRCVEVAVVSNLAPLLVVAVLELKMAEGLAMTLTNAGGAWWIRG